MDEHTIMISGMTCHSCEKIIGKYVSDVQGVELVSLEAASGKMVVRVPEGKIGEVEKAVHDSGYKIAGETGEKKTAGENAAGSSGEKETGEKKDGCAGEKKAGCSGCAEKGEGGHCGNEEDCDVRALKANHVLKNLMSSKPQWKAERRLLLYSAGALTALLLILAFMYAGMWRGIPGFESKMLPLLVLGAVGVTALVGCGYHFNSYHKPITCSTGMMEGMTFGMMAGFIIGGLAGATNGMFWGSIIGLAAGCAAGWWGGKASGVMGVMEGLMAGVMSGTMGAMLSVMLLAEPLPLFLALIIFACVLILLMLSYMNVKELGLIGQNAEIATFTSVASTSVIFFILLAVIMLYGPKSGPVWGAI